MYSFGFILCIFTLNILIMLLYKLSVIEEEF